MQLFGGLEKETGSTFEDLASLSNNIVVSTQTVRRGEATSTLKYVDLKCGIRLCLYT